MKLPYIPQQFKLWFGLIDRGLTPFELATYILVSRDELPRIEDLILDNKISYATARAMDRDTWFRLPVCCTNCGLPVPETSVPGGLLINQCSTCSDDNSLPILHNQHLAQVSMCTGYPDALIEYWFALHLMGWYDD